MLVHEVMSRSVVTVRDDDTVRFAGAILLKHRIASAPVVDADGHLVGVVSESDLLRNRVEDDPRAHLRDIEEEHERQPLLVVDVMSPHVLTVHEGDDASLAARLLLDHGIKALPVVHGRRVTGIVARRDLLRALARPDTDVRRDVLALLTEMGQDGCDVVVDDGTVTLLARDGHGDARVAAALARTVPGVVRVLAG